MNYQEIYGTSEIFSKTQCIQQENTFVKFLGHILSSLGYTSQDTTEHIWRRGDKRVWLAIVDDIEGIANGYQEDVYNNLTKNDIIITDSWFSRPLAAKVLRLPNSWFGIYAFRPELYLDKPTKLYSLAINRIDFVRVMIMLELAYQKYLYEDSLVNFNCVKHTDQGDEPDKTKRWIEIYNDLDIFYKDRYRNTFEQLTPMMPFNNFPPDVIGVEIQHQESMLNIVVETYSSDYSVALSEKTFRALTLPRLWRVFGGMWTVKHLESMGFDCMTDVSRHETDQLKSVEDKITRFIHGCKKVWSETTWNEDLKNRATAAAEHNINLLFKMKQQWPSDFAAWLPGVVKELE